MDRHSASHTDGRPAFVYGTLQVPAILERVLERVPTLLQASLRGYQRGRLAGQVYPAIIPAADALTVGHLLVGLRDDEWPLLDAYEGQLYERHNVTVICTDEVARGATCYVLRPEYADLFDPTPWSLETFVVRDLAAFLRDWD